MFFLKLNRIKIHKRREFIGKAEIQILSAATKNLNEVNLFQELHKNQDSEIKTEIVREMCNEVFSGITFTPIEKVKNNQEIRFGPEGLVLFQSEEIPEVLHFQLLIIELDRESRNAGQAIDMILMSGKDELVNKGVKLATLTTPAGMAKGIIDESLKLISNVLVNDKDDQVGLFISSFTELPNSKNSRKVWKDLKDTTGNLSIDISLLNE